MHPNRTVDYVRLNEPEIYNITHTALCSVCAFNITAGAMG
jgi:hypothetical protein